MTKQEFINEIRDFLLMQEEAVKLDVEENAKDVEVTLKEFMTANWREVIAQDKWYLQGIGAVINYLERNI